MQIRREIEELSTLESESPRIISLYLDVDGRRFANRDEVATAAGQLLRKAEKNLEAAELISHEDVRQVESDLQRINEWIRLEFQRNGAKGLAIFADEQQNLFRVMHLPKSVDSSVHIDRKPHLGGLAHLLDSVEDYGILLVNKEAARMFKYSNGELQELSSVFEEVPNKHHKGGWSQSRFQRHHEDHVHRHIRHVADATLEYVKRERFDKLLVSASEEIWPELERTFHSYISERMRKISIDINAPNSKVSETAAGIEATDEADRESALVDRLQQELNSEGLGVTGVDDTLNALTEARIGALLVRERTHLTGNRCENCGHLSSTETVCPFCSREMQTGVDLVEAMVEDALAQGCELHFISPEVPSWAVSDVGAILRY